MLHDIRSLPAPAVTSDSAEAALARRAAAALLAGPLADLSAAAEPAAPGELAALVLHAAGGGDVAPLLAWLTDAAGRRWPHPVVLDVAAGVPLAAGSYLGQAEVDALAAAIRALGDVPATVADGPTGPETTVGVTLYDALGRDDVRLLLARLVQLFAPGVPCLSPEALVCLPAAGTLPVGEDAVAALLRRPVMDAVLRVVRLRQEHPAFAGTFDCGPGVVPVGEEAGAAAGVEPVPDGTCLTAAELRALVGGPAQARRALDADADPDDTVRAAWLRWRDGEHQVVLQIVPEQDAFRLAVTTGSGWACARSVREVRELAVPVPA